MRRFLTLWIVLAAAAVPALPLAQSNAAADAARRWRQQHERAIVEELNQLLSMPNVSSDRPNIQRNAEHIVALMQKHGVAARLV